MARALADALTPAVNLGYPPLSSLLMSSACDFVAGMSSGAGDGSGSSMALGGLSLAPPWLPAAKDLGLAPLDCTGGLPAPAPSSGMFFGLGSNGLVGLVRM